MRLSLIVCVFSVAASDLLADAKLFPGRWELVSVERDGVAKKVAGQGAVIKKNKAGLMTLQWTGKANPGPGIYLMSINPKTKPKSVDISFGGPGSLAVSIYEFKNGELRICVGKSMGSFSNPKWRPKAFKTAKGDGRTLYRFKQAKGKK